jgi:hypothetical protein
VGPSSPQLPAGSSLHACYMHALLQSTIRDQLGSIGRGCSIPLLVDSDPFTFTFTGWGWRSCQIQTAEEATSCYRRDS